MSRLMVGALFGWAVVLVGPAARADEPKPAEDPNHEALRQLRADVEKAVNDKNLDELLKHVDPNVIVVWQNGEISRGHQGVRDYYKKTLADPNAPLDSYTMGLEIKDLTTLYEGKTGISAGTMNSHFKFKDGRTMDVSGPFSATLVKEDGKWMIASAHASVGLFDNPLVVAERNLLYWACGVAAVVGLAVGALVMALLRRRKAA